MAKTPLYGPDGFIGFLEDLLPASQIPALPGGSTPAAAVQPPGGGGPAPVLPPPQPDVSLTTRDDVITWYAQYLGRYPEDEGAIEGRVGLPRTLVEMEIANSPEAVAHRAAAGVTGPTGPAGPAVPKRPPAVRPPSPIPGLDGILDFLDNSLRAMEGAIFPKLDAISAFLSTQLVDKIKEAAKAALDVAGAVSQQLASAITSLIPTALDLASHALAQVENLVGEFLKNAADVTDVAGAFVGAIGEKEQQLADFVVGNVGTAFAGGLAGFFEHLEGEAPELITSTVDRLLAAPALPDDAREILTAMRSRTRPVNFLLGMLLGAFSLGSISGAVMSPVIEELRQGANAAAPVFFQGPQELADLTARGWTTDGDARALARRQGYDDVPFDLAKRLAFQFPTPDAAIAAWQRDIVPAAERDELLHRQGFQPRESEILTALGFFVPPAQDVVRFLTRDVFIPEFVERFGMDLEYPIDADAYFKKVGLTHDTAMLYWRAHWELPSVSQGYEMFQRGKIEEVDLRRLLRAQGVEPFWRDPIIAVSYNPITRVDVRRINKMGLLDHAGMVRRYRDIGYNPDDAELLAKFTEQLNAGQKKADLQALNAGLKSRIVTAMISGSLDYHEGSFTLGDLGYSDTDVAAFIAEAESLRAEAHYEQLATDVRDLYVESFWTWDEAAAYLRSHTYNDRELTLLKEEWDLRKELKGPKAHVLRDRDLTVGEILDAYQDAIFTKAETTDALLALRFDAHEVAALIGIREHTIAKAELADALAVIQAKFHAGKLDYNGAAGELDKLGVRATHRDALLAKWEPTKLANVSALGYATIGELVKRKLIDDPAADAYLVKLGYDATDRRLSLALWGSQAAEAAQRALQAADKAATAATAAQEAQARRTAAEAERIRRSIPHLSRADLLKALKAKVLTDVEVRAELARRGMPAGEIETLMATVGHP